MLPNVEHFRLNCNKMLLYLLQQASHQSASEVLGNLRDLGMPLLKRIRERTLKHGGHGTNSSYEVPFPGTQIQLKFKMRADCYRTNDLWSVYLEVVLPTRTVSFDGKQLDEIIMESVVLGHDFEIKQKIGKSKLAQQLMDQ